MLLQEQNMHVYVMLLSGVITRGCPYWIRTRYIPSALNAYWIRTRYIQSTLIERRRVVTFPSNSSKQTPHFKSTNRLEQSDAGNGVTVTSLTTHAMFLADSLALSKALSG